MVISSSRFQLDPGAHSLAKSDPVSKHACGVPLLEESQEKIEKEVRRIILVINLEADRFNVFYLSVLMSLSHA